MCRIFFTLLMASFSVIVDAQVVDSLLYILIKDSLPKGYNAHLTKKGVIISRTDSVYTLPNFNNVDETIASDVVPSGSKKAKYILNVTSFSKWSDKQIKNAINENQNQVSKIYAKYKISEIKDSMDMFFPKNEDEQARLMLYYEECEFLQPKLITIPNYHSGKYSFAIISNISYAGKIIIPYSIANETYLLENKIRAIIKRHFSSTK